jgi:hypothetical protein
MLRSKMVKLVSDGAGAAGGGDGVHDEPSWHEFLMVPAANRKEIETSWSTLLLIIP